MQLFSLSVPDVFPSSSSLPCVLSFLACFLLQVSYLIWFSSPWLDIFSLSFISVKLIFLTTAIIVQGPPGLPGLKGDPGSKGEKVSAPSFCRVCLCAVSFPRFEIG